MNSLIINSYVVAALCAACLLTTAHSDIDVPSDGSDGELNVNANPTWIDLSEAVPGRWDMDNRESAGKGVFDEEKWAIVFKYKSVNIARTGGVRFVNHPANPPVVWLVEGDVEIAGSIVVQNIFDSTVPGPGGFRGGTGPNYSAGGHGPGRGDGISTFASSYQKGGEGSGREYGNSEIVPLIGGSGSSHVRAGGGAILIAARGEIRFGGGTITANGHSSGGAPPSSGGAVRLVCEKLSGVGSIFARAVEGAAGNGRIRIEADAAEGNITTFPQVIAVKPENPPKIWPEPDTPTARVVSIGGHPVPDKLTARMEAPSADINFQREGEVEIVVETTNMPVNSDVLVHLTAKHARGAVLTAEHVAGNEAKSTWSVTTPVTDGFTAVLVHAVEPDE